MEENREIASRIKNIRLNNGWTLEQFGEKLGASKVSVHNWESGRNLPNKKRLKKIAELGNLTINELLSGSIDDSILNEINSFFDNQEAYEFTKERKKEITEDALQQSKRKPWIQKTYKGLYDEDQQLFKGYILDEVHKAIERSFNHTEYTNKGFIRFTTIGLEKLKRELKDYSLNGINDELYNDTINIIEIAKNNIFDLHDKHDID